VHDLFTYAIQPLFVIFGIFMILSAVLDGMADAMERIGRKDLADDFDKMVDRGLMKPYDWMAWFADVTTFQLVVSTKRTLLGITLFVVACVMAARL